VVQRYSRDCLSEYVAYDSVLRGFERVSLEPGKSATVHFRIGREELEVMGRDMKWVVEPGDFEGRIGSRSVDIRLKDKITVES
jgi:beta-glucosidase